MVEEASLVKSFNGARSANDLGTKETKSYNLKKIDTGLSICQHGKLTRTQIKAEKTDLHRLSNLTWRKTRGGQGRKRWGGGLLCGVAIIAVRRLKREMSDCSRDKEVCLLVFLFVCFSWYVHLWRNGCSQLLASYECRRCGIKMLEMKYKHRWFPLSHRHKPHLMTAVMYKTIDRDLSKDVVHFSKKSFKMQTKYWSWTTLTKVHSEKWHCVLYHPTQRLGFSCSFHENHWNPLVPLQVLLWSFFPARPFF